MALFSSKLGRDQVDDEEYEPVMDEEHKPLRVDSDGEYAPPQLAHQEIYALSRSLRRTNLFLKVIIGLLCVTIVALLSINIPEKVKSMMKDISCSIDPLIKTPVPQSKLPHIIPHIASSPLTRSPPVGMQKVIFEKHAVYSQRPNTVSNAAWDALLPEGRGFVYIPEWEKYDLPPGQNTTWGMIYSVAVFHQMHCLGQLRRFTYMFLDAITKNDTEKMKSITHMFTTMDHGEHVTHCFDYLRQTISCAGDMAMEWPRTEPDGERIAVDGWGIPHECKDWVSHIVFV
jgi:mycotoxin biosynthesis protein UstYa